MREESEDHRFAARIGSKFFQPRYDLPVPKVHPVKGAYGNHGVFYRLEFIYIMVDAHLLSFMQY
jgi:hypothetical protein